jgi:hypothetical protein
VRTSGSNRYVRNNLDASNSSEPTTTMTLATEGMPTTAITLATADTSNRRYKQQQSRDVSYRRDTSNSLPKHSRLRERGRGEKPIRTKGQTLWYTRYSIKSITPLR